MVVDINKKSAVIDTVVDKMVGKRGLGVCRINLTKQTAKIG